MREVGLWLSGPPDGPAPPDNTTGLWVSWREDFGSALTVRAADSGQMLCQRQIPQATASKAAESLGISLPHALDHHAPTPPEKVDDLLTLILLFCPSLGLAPQLAAFDQCTAVIERAVEHTAVLEQDRPQTLLTLLAALGQRDPSAGRRAAVVALCDPAFPLDEIDLATQPDWLADLLRVGPGRMKYFEQPHHHCLWIDDEIDLPILVRGMFRREIRDEVHQFTFTTRGESALEILEENQDISLVLTDINMPGMDGFKLTHLIKERHPHLDVYMVTAYGDSSNIRHAMREGVRDFIPKPLDRNRIRACLAHRLPTLPQRHHPLQTDGHASVHLLTSDKYLPGLLTRTFRDQIRQGLIKFRRHEELSALVDALETTGHPAAVILESDVNADSIVPMAAPMLRWAYPHLTVMVAGGPGELDDFRGFMARGVFDFVPRPMPIDDLTQMINLAALSQLEHAARES